MSRITLRNIELRDIDFIYKAKNNHRLNETSLGVCENFSYEDAVKWVKGCMNTESNYKYWAVCSNDEFQNIVGWCGISDIDMVNQMAYFRTIVIFHPKYRDSVAWYETWNFVLYQVFDVLRLNRLYAECLTTNKFHYQFKDNYPEFYEGTKRQAVFKNGKFFDVAIFGILRNEYESYKNKGLWSFEFIQKFMKSNNNPNSVTINDIEDFISVFANELDTTDPRSILPETRFRDLDEWSSLLAITLVSIAENGLHTNFDMSELNKCDTIRDLYEMVKSRSDLD